MDDDNISNNVFNNDTLNDNHLNYFFMNHFDNPIQMNDYGNGLSNGSISTNFFPKFSRFGEDKN